MKLKDTLIDEFDNLFDIDSDYDPTQHRVIEVTESYRLHVTVQPTIPDGHYHLKIESQWLGAKDPNGLQTRYQVTLSRKHLLELTQTLLEATR
jgi:hypothetical protein